MGDLFVRILNISMISCYTIVVVMVLRALLLRWERKFVYFLWFVVFVNLCIPFRLEGPFSLVPAWVADFDIDRRSEGGQPVVSEGEADDLPNEVIATITYSGISHNYDVPAGGGVPGTDSNSEASFIQDGAEGKVDYLPNEQITTTAISSHEDAPDRMGGVPGTDSNDGTTYHEYHTGDGREKNARRAVMAFVWGAGVLLLAAGNIWAVWKFRGKIGNAEPFSEECAAGIRTIDGIESPFLWGLFPPVIYLPRSIDAQECTYVIAHEDYHRKRRDYIFKPLFWAVAVIHWFNPLVWAAYFLFVRDMEISCDEAVIANADEDIRKKYAESLLKYAARQNGYTLTPITFGEPSLKCRIRNVLQYRERNVMGSAFVLCGVLVVMAGLFFKPRQEALMTLPAGRADAQTAQGIPGMLAADSVDRGALDDKALSEGANWRSGMIRGTDGENEYTKILMGSDMVSGEAADFRTFAYADNDGAKEKADEEERDGMNAVAYVMAGDETDGVITGSLWRVDVRSKAVQPVMQDIAMADTQAASIVFDDAAYVILNYRSGNRADGRILPVTGDDLTTEIMSDLSGEKRIGDREGTILCNGYAYWLVDAETVREADGHDASQDEEEWSPWTAHRRGDRADRYQIGQEYEPTDAVQRRIDGLVPCCEGNMDAFFDYCDEAVSTKGRARRRDAYSWVNLIGRTENFEFYGMNTIDTILVGTPDGKYVRIDSSFSSNYWEVPFWFEEDLDEDGERELVIMGGFGSHGTGFYMEQLFVVDRGADGSWYAYELHDDIYLPMIQQHMDTVYGDESVELQIDGRGVGHPFANDEIIDASARYGAGAQIRFGYGESGILPYFVSREDRILGDPDNPDKKIVLDAGLAVYSDTCVSGVFPGNHFVAELAYEGDGAWRMTEYHHEFQDEH